MDTLTKYLNKRKVDTTVNKVKFISISVNYAANTKINWIGLLKKRVVIRIQRNLVTGGRGSKL